MLDQFYAEKQERAHTGVGVHLRHALAARALRLHTRPPRKRLLDIGCGEGIVAAYLRDTLGFREAHGVEIAPGACERAAARGVVARALNLDSGPLPFADGFFDAILCSEVIEHVIDTDHLLEEIRRTLKPGGVAAITTPNLAGWINRAALAIGWQPFSYDVSLRHKVGRPRFGSAETSGHLHMFTHRALKELLRAHGFEIIAIEGLPGSDGPLPASGRAPQKAGLPWYLRAFFPFDRLLTRLRPSLSVGLLAVVRAPGPSERKASGR